MQNVLKLIKRWVLNGAFSVRYLIGQFGQGRYIDTRHQNYDSCLRVSTNMYRLFNVMCWLWNIYEGTELPRVYFITNTKQCITYLALTQLLPRLLTHTPHILKYTYYVVISCISFRNMSFRL